jgi:hypothetical protein
LNLRKRSRRISKAIAKKEDIKEITKMTRGIRWLNKMRGI